MSAIYRKELKIYFSGVLGFVIAALLLVFSGIFFTFTNLSQGYTDFLYTLDPMKLVLILAVPLLTMRTIAEERHSRTDQLLYSLPIRLTHVVLGKYFAMLTVFLLPTLVMGLYPLLMSYFGEISLASAYTALFGYFLMGAALIALCTLISALVESQILAGAISLVVCFAFWFLQWYSVGILPDGAVASFLICAAACLVLGVMVWRLSRNLTVGLFGALIALIPTLLLFLIKKSLFERLVPDFLETVNLYSRVVGFFYGYFDVKGLLFYLTCIFVCLFLTVQSMDARRKI